MQDSGDLSPLLQRLFSARGIRHVEELDFSLDRLLPYEKLPGIDQALELLTEALHTQERLLVVGDYDVDGAAAAAVLIRALRQFGFRCVDYAVPSRFHYGYGLSPKLVEEAHKQHQPQTIITVDNGISSVEGVAAANALGMRVIITDHHLVGETMPAAAAIVNPNLPDSNFSSRALAGVGVAFYLMLGLRERLMQKSWFAADRSFVLEELLDLVALGTVADLVPLDANNRILVDYGLRLIRSGRSHAGIKALFKAAGRIPSLASSTDLSFAIAPRLNAAGRLQDMEKGIACLLSDNEKEAEALARDLDVLNKARRTIEGKTLQDAKLKIEKQLDRRHPEKGQGLCVYEPDWHEGLIGLIASRLREHIDAPVFVFTRAQDGRLRGSGRSIRTVHLRDLVADIANQEPELIVCFGGHSQAAGMTITEQNYPRFEQLFNLKVADCMARQENRVELLSDGCLSTADLCYQTAERLRTMAPWGMGFPEPVFDGEFYVSDSRVFAQKHRQLMLKPDLGSDFHVRGILFNAEQHAMLDKALHQVHILYSLEADAFRNRRAANLIIRRIQAIE